MRMTVESLQGETVSVVWCHEGKIGRDSFDEKLLNKWEFRADDRPAPRGGDRPGGGGGYRGNNDRGGDRPGGGGGYRGNNDRGGDRPGGGDFGGRSDRFGGDRGGKTGWDGKPREKKHFRNDD